MKIISATFLKSSFKKEQWAQATFPEIAFAGRSNVGKSSIINSLLNRQKLVKTSSTPGKTRSINFFEINQKFIFTDLPGYGFARGDKAEIKKWKPMVEEYLSQRETLKAIVHIVDVRRKPNEMEEMLLEWITGNKIPHILVASKADKLSKSAGVKSARTIEKLLGKKPLLYSSLKGTGKQELWGLIKPFLLK